MSPSRSVRTVLPQPDPEVLTARLASLRGALGAARVGVARRVAMVPSFQPSPTFEVLAAVGMKEPFPTPERATPLSAFQRLLEEGRVLEVDAEGDGAIARWLRRHSARRLLGWPLPADRLPCVFLVAIYDADRDPGRERLHVAREGMEALARALAPPAWLPLTTPALRHQGGLGLPAPEVGGTMSGSAEDTTAEAAALQQLLPLDEAVNLVERIMIRRALQCSEGNKSAAARTLRMSRQGFYKKLKRHGLL